MDIKKIKDKNTFKDPIVLEISFGSLIPALISIIAIVQIYENNRKNNLIREKSIK